MVKTLSVSRGLWFGFGVITIVTIGIVLMFSADANKDKSSQQDLSVFAQLQGLFGWVSDNYVRHARSEGRQLLVLDDNTNPDEPNPQILNRVPRKTVWELIFGRLPRRESAYNDASRNLRNDTEDRRSITTPLMSIEESFVSMTSHHQARNRRALGPLGRPGPRPRGLKQRVVVNGKWYGQIRKEAPLEEDTTRPPPKIIDQLAHLRNRPLTAKEQKLHDLRNNKRHRMYVAKREKGQERKRLVRKMIEQRKHLNKNTWKNIARSKYAMFLKRSKTPNKEMRKPYTPRKVNQANYGSKTNKFRMKKPRKWVPKIIKRTTHRLRNQLNDTKHPAIRTKIQRPYRDISGKEKKTQRGTLAGGRRRRTNHNRSQTGRRRFPFFNSIRG